MVAMKFIEVAALWMMPSMACAATGQAGPCGNMPCNCGKAGAAQSAGVTFADGVASVVPVKIQGFQFVPSVVEIEVGDAITWTNLDAIEHTATSQTGPGTLAPDGMFDSGKLSLTGTYSFTFSEVGEFDYFCLPHGSSMQGVIKVIIPAPATAALGMAGVALMTRRRRG